MSSQTQLPNCTRQRDMSSPDDTYSNGELSLWLRKYKNSDTRIVTHARIIISMYETSSYFMNMKNLPSVTVPQMVAHLLWPASLHHPVAGPAHHSAQETPSYPPRSPSRDLLLYHHRMAQLPSGNNPLLDRPRKHHRIPHRPQASGWRPQVGKQELKLDDVLGTHVSSISFIFYVCFMTVLWSSTTGL